MGGSAPTISVCIPTYNYGRFLGDALDSALSQTFTDLEVIVVDNCSTDDTPDVVRAYQARDGRVRYVRNPANVGAQRNLNRCIDLASGEYVNVLCADDLLEPTALERLLGAFRAHPRVALAGCARVVVDVNLHPMRVLSYSRREEVVPGAEAVRRCLIAGNRIGEPSAVLFRKRDAVRGFDTTYRQLVDLEMWFHLLGKGDFAFVPEPLCRFRFHEGSETRRNADALSFVPEFQRIVAGYTPREGDLALRHGWRVQLAFDVWARQFRGLSFVDAHRSIRRIYPLAPFYLFLPFKLLAMGSEALRGRRTMLRLARQGGYGSVGR